MPRSLQSWLLKPTFFSRYLYSPFIKRRGNHLLNTRRIFHSHHYSPIQEKPQNQGEPQRKDSIQNQDQDNLQNEEKIPNHQRIQKEEGVFKLTANSPRKIQEELRMAENTDPPVEEPPGYSARAGWVKSRWENNDYYVEQFANDPWYPIIRDTHEAIKRLVPNYNIAQIKEKFGGLRYYVNFPEIQPKDGDTPEEIRNQVHELITYAEGWVDGFEHARKAKEQEDK